VRNSGIRGERAAQSPRLIWKTGVGLKRAPARVDTSEASKNLIRSASQERRMTAMRPTDLSTHICAADYFLILLRRCVSGPAHASHATESTQFAARGRISAGTEERDGRHCSQARMERPRQWRQHRVTHCFFSFFMPSLRATCGLEIEALLSGIFATGAT
jgi:hypothetical protein